MDLYKDNGGSAFEAYQKHATWRTKAVFTGAPMDDIYKLNQPPAYLKHFNNRSDYKHADNITDIVDYNTLQMKKTF